MRDEVALQRKLDEVTDALRQWVKQNHVLEAGERIIVRFRIEKIPTVMAEGIEIAEALPASGISAKELTARQVYDAVLRVRSRLGTVSQPKVMSELRANSGLMARFSRKGDPLRQAYDAALRNESFPQTLE